MFDSIAITQATARDVPPSLEILLDSYLGEEYFTREVAGPILREAAEKEELFVAKAEDGEILGFYRINMRGTFSVFPYLALIAVRKDVRGEGLGTRLLRHVEERIVGERDCLFCTKIFLLLGKNNTRAQGFYAKNGYVRVGTIPSLFEPGVDEYLMMKNLK